MPAVTPLLPERSWERFPYAPADPKKRDGRCAEVYRIQVHGWNDGARRVGASERAVPARTGAARRCAGANKRWRDPRRRS